MIRTAEISDDGVYRYTLERRWEEDPRTIVWVMCNPSIADAEVDDPTIRRCIRFSRDWGFPGLVVVNLYAFRATKPAKMQLAEDAIGPDNERAIRSTIGDPYVDQVMFAWGSSIVKTGCTTPQSQAWATGEAHKRGHAVMCLGRTTLGYPRHPLYVPAATMPEPWRA